MSEPPLWAQCCWRMPGQSRTHLPEFSHGVEGEGAGHLPTAPPSRVPTPTPSVTATAAPAVDLLCGTFCPLWGWAQQRGAGCWKPWSRRAQECSGGMGGR